MHNSITVIGTIFMDCKGFAGPGYQPQGRNLGSVRFFHGGVGRNIAENLAQLGANVRFLAATDASPIAKDAVERLNHAGVDTGSLILNETKGVGLWLAVLDESGNLQGSVSQMPDLSLLEKTVQDKKDQYAEESAWMAVELDLSPAITNHMLEAARSAGIPVFGIPGNLDVILRDPAILSQTELFICNHIEAARIWPEEVAGLDGRDIAQALPAIVSRHRLRHLVVTLAEQGSVYFDADRLTGGYQPALPVEVVDTTGAGDAFFSGTVAAITQGEPLAQAVARGARVAAWTIASEENTHPDLRRLASANWR